MLTRRSILAFALPLACLLAFAGAAGGATPYRAADFKLPVCEGADLAPAPGEGDLVPLCRETKQGRTFTSLGTLTASGTLLKRALPGGASGPFAPGPAGEIWAGTGTGGANLGLDRIAADGIVTEFPLGTAQEEHNALEIYGLVPDGEGAVWVAIGELGPEWYFHPFDSLGGELLHIAADGTVTRFPVPEDVEPQALVRGPDGNLWFTGESGRAASEHVAYLGKGYVGRMTPAGDFALYPTAVEQSAPGGIAVGPDGRLWFTETSRQANEIGSIGTDGAFGPSVSARNLQGPLAFGPEGDVWASMWAGVMRITPQGQHTLFRLSGAQGTAEAKGVVAGAEGDIWTHGLKSVQRIVPGAPGIDTSSIEADRRSKTLRVQLACGGSERGCEGDLVLSTAPHERERKPGVRLARVHYSVAAESQRGLTIQLTAKAFALVRQDAAKNAGFASMVVHATVAGGPTLDRLFYVPGFVAK
jgi:virginiamycin B lyase